MEGPTGDLLHEPAVADHRSEEHTSELQSRLHLVCRLLLEKKKHKHRRNELPNSKNHTWDLICSSRVPPGDPSLCHRALHHRCFPEPRHLELRRMSGLARDC